MIANFSEYSFVLVCAQVLHAFSFGAMHAAAIYFVHHHFSFQNQGKAQAMYSSLGFGLGGFVGAMCMAALVKLYEYGVLFLVSAGVVVIALFVVSLLKEPVTTKDA